MDLVKSGKFIAKLRKDQHMTQEQLGEVLGVTNKTVSRWENGNYMPNIEMLQLLSQLFEVSINDLLSGERIPDEDLRRQAEQNLIDIAKESAFSFEEQRRFWIHKWRREHIALFALLALILAAAVILPLLANKTGYLGLAPMIALIEYGWQNNRMMSYVDDQLYGKEGR